MKKLVIIIILATAMHAASAADYGARWNDFLKYSSSAGGDSGFPLIDSNDLGSLGPELVDELIKIDSNTDGSISVEEYFLYYEKTTIGIPILYSADKESKGSFRQKYGTLLNQYVKVEKVVGGDTSLIFETFIQYQGTGFVASNDFYTFLNGGLFKLPPYFKNGFMGLFKEFLSDSPDKVAFRNRYDRLILYLSNIGQRADTNSANKVKSDLLMMKDIYKIYGFDELLSLYQKLEGVYFGSDSSDKESVSSDIRNALEILSRFANVVTSTPAATPGRKALNLADFLANIFINDSASASDLRGYISSDWQTLTGFLRSKGGGRKIVQEMQRFIANGDFYFAIQPQLPLYLDSYFNLQLETDLPLRKIVTLFASLAEVYPSTVVHGTAEVFRNSPSFVYKNEDQKVFYAIHLCYIKTGDSFTAAFRYFVVNSESASYNLNDMVKIYELLETFDILYLVDNKIPLDRLKRVTQEYSASLGFHLPLFARLYGENGKNNGIFKTIDNSFPFHKALTVNDINTLRNIWNAGFYFDFLTLLEIAETYPGLMMPLSQEKKMALFQLFQMASKHSAEYEQLLRFNLDVLVDAAFSSEGILFFDRIFSHSEGDREANKIYARSYIPILRDLVIIYQVRPYEEHAFLLMDLTVANSYKREEVASALAKEITYLKEITVLELLKRISANDYSPDIILALNVCSVSFEAENIRLTANFIDDFITKDDINREVFQYGMIEVNKLFPVKDFYNKKTLLTIYHMLNSLSADKRQTIVSSLSLISYLRKHINNPGDLNDSISMMEQLDRLNSDLYNELFLTAIPLFDHLITASVQLITIFRQLEEVNQFLSRGLPVLADKSFRVKYFTEIIKPYAPLIKDIAKLKDSLVAMFVPLQVWKDSPQMYTELLNYPIPEILKAHKSDDFVNFFSALHHFLTMADKQREGIMALNAIEGDFYSRNHLSQVADYMAAVKAGDVAVEGGKGIYFAKVSRSNKKALNRVLNKSMKSSNHVFWDFGMEGGYDFQSASILAGGSLGLAFPFSGGFLNYFAPALYLDVQYLYDLNTAASELNPALGLRFPIPMGGISKRSDFVSTIDFGIATGLFLNGSGSINIKHTILQAGLKGGIDIGQAIRINLAAKYGLVFDPAQNVSHRAGGALEFHFLK